MTYLLKEWSVVCQALNDGLQTIIARKGGLLDEDGIFHVAHNQFFLWPTYLHQHRSFVKPQFQSLFDQIPLDPGSGRRIELKNFAQVTDQYFVRDWSKLQSLNHYHIWNDHFLRQRFQWGGQQGLFLVALRVFRLQEPITISHKPAYAGCKSWVELEENKPVPSMTPVLPDGEFARQRQRLKNAILSASSK